jgi:hypothetical protein
MSEQIVSNTNIEFESFKPLYMALCDSNYKNIPIIDIGKKCGHTDYIDFIVESDMKYPVMKGVDICRRPFLALKLQKDNGKKSNFVITIFQRYTDNNNTWCYGTCYEFGLFWLNNYLSSLDNEYIYYRLNELFNGRSVRSIASDETNYNEGSGDYVITLAIENTTNENIPSIPLSEV